MKKLCGIVENHFAATRTMHCVRPKSSTTGPSTDSKRKLLTNRRLQIWKCQSNCSWRNLTVRSEMIPNQLVQAMNLDTFWRIQKVCNYVGVGGIHWHKYMCGNHHQSTVVLPTQHDWIHNNYIFNLLWSPATQIWHWCQVIVWIFVSKYYW